MVKNVITNGKLPLKKFIEMELSLLPFTITTDTGDYSYIPEKIRGFDWYCPFWHQRATFLRTKPICNFGSDGSNE
jgi:hypothetical protein